MKKTIVITTWKREVWLIRQLPGASQGYEINKPDRKAQGQIPAETLPDTSTRRKQ